MASRDEVFDEEMRPGGGYDILRTPAQAFRDHLTVRSYEAGREGGVHPATILRYLEHLATCASAALGFDNHWYRDQIDVPGQALSTQDDVRATLQ